MLRNAIDNLLHTKVFYTEMSSQKEHAPAWKRCDNKVMRTTD
jgi:hypothetical protein